MFWFCSRDAAADAAEKETEPESVQEDEAILLRTRQDGG